MERLQKLISIAGVASRRASEELILQGRVEVNGEVVRTLGSKADPATDVVKVDGRRLRFDVRPRYILLNKPKGVVTTRKDPQGRRTVIELLKGVREFVYPVGRLDFDSEGLLLLTSDGNLAARLTHPRHEVPRVYEAVVAGSPAEESLDKLRRGISSTDREPRPPKSGGWQQAEEGRARNPMSRTCGLPCTKAETGKSAGCAPVLLEGVPVGDDAEARARRRRDRAVVAISSVTGRSQSRRSADQAGGSNGTSRYGHVENASAAWRFASRP